MDDRLEDAVGALTLADSMLGDQVVEIHKLAAYGSYPGPMHPPRVGDTTRKSASELSRVVYDEPALFPASTEAWLERVEGAVEQRDRVVHAVARGQCAECGKEWDFVHPRSGDTVDRSREAVQAMTDVFRQLRVEGAVIAKEVAQRVNDRLVRVARERAAASGEPQTPPQVAPDGASYLCADCGHDGKGSVTINGAPAVVVMPPGWDPTSLFGGHKSDPS